ncbi:Metalloenzyme, LuxS/M16 peptidase-like protein [Aspergillus alliaceus]|uniref:Metalloenzyme, LuxS/M16 peptidase-like protein n=1 Tax=Petromyces alliaceus TaxID=209559 RepID=A0A5N6GBJ4_PETAA|nr:Metalloenzyme, LuxS/M16 peptidase-like protein [Aspergillus alliaceus]KAB8239766.1 Metalloenzyme, LuxS/M16 peptidase-like protein [Aspergillus alliaceus]KAE8394596.1 Metalloenzyme, LuxS/M16 peptidase-like protein [Aspergillus alliaceus]
MSPSQKSHFKLLQKFKPDYSPSEFVQYESERTGMRVVVIDQKGPKVTGYFVLATEIHDDSGAPHTLEHLCFMGSRNYRYKGFLDKLATRVYSSTNAWTATDHTAYTLDTAGWEGFAQILPVYLEHVIAPTLTDEGCYTEVHHVDGTGNDAGVVYSEMQGVQNNAAELIDLTARRLTYPHGVGFRYETGGMMEQLRILTAERIRAFHREMYQPKNLCLIITGEVDHANMLETLDNFENTILDVIPSPDAPFKRPWVDSKQAPPLGKTFVEKVEFPEEDESFGEIEIRFLGPDCTDPIQTGAVNVALLYLAGSSASLLDNILVEKEQLASAVYYATEDHPSLEIRFTLTSVETDKLTQVEQRFFDVLKDAMEKELDMKYLKECIDRQRRTWKFSTESSASSLAEYVISDFLFGKRDGSTLLDVATLKEYDVLEQWSENEWRNFIKRWISDAPHVTILGVPSTKMSDTLKREEEARVAAQKKRLGEDGLKQLAQKLEKAKAENDKEIPKELLEKFRIPGVESIHFVETTTARSGAALKAGRPDHAAQKLVDADGSEMPLFIHFEHIPSNFVQLSLLISAQSVPVQLRPLLSVYTEAFFNLPVQRDGKTINFEEVVVELERDTVGYSMEGARSLGNSEMLRISFQVELEKYSTAIAWLQELSWSSVFDVERLRAITSRLLSDVPDSKRSGDDMLAAVHVMVHYAAESIVRARSTLVKARYLKRIKRQLAEEPEIVVARMEEIRKALFQFENMRVLVIADLEKLKSPVSAWKPFVERLGANSTLQPITARRPLLSDAGQKLGERSYVVPMPTIDSSFAYATARGLDSYNDPRLPALLVAIAYMNAVEGPLWVAVRGTGLAYGTNFAYNIDTGFVNFDVYRSPNAHKAFESSKQIVKNHLSGAVPFDPLMLEGSISSIVVSYANEQATIAGAAQGSFTRQVVRNLPSDYKEKMLKQVRNISVEDIKGALRDIILPLFEPKTANIVITCATVLEETIKEGLQSSGFTPVVQPLKEFEDDYGLKVGDDEDEESDDEDEDDDEYETGSEDDEDDDEDDE